MRTIPLIARRAFTYHGRTVQPGEVIQASAIEAVSLRYRGQARFAPKAVVPPAPTVTPRAVVSPAPAPVVEAPESAPTEPSDVTEPTPDADGDFETLPKRRRSYKRRDLEAEG